MCAARRTVDDHKPGPRWGELLTGTALSWLLPGAGHWLLGHRLRGVLLGASILTLFWAGELVYGQKLAVSREVHPFFFIAQAGNGASAFLADYLWGEPSHGIGKREIDRDLPRHLNFGILCTLLSGLLNVLLILHAMDPRSWEARSLPQPRESGGSVP